MKITNIIDELIHVPRRFNSIGTMSIYALLKETGYFEIHDQISVENIRDALTRYPECVDDWMLYSEDKRSSSGWYFKQVGDEKYIVGCLKGNKSYDSHGEYNNRLDACAFFIKHEIDNIRTS